VAKDVEFAPGEGEGVKLSLCYHASVALPRAVLKERL